MSASPDIHSRLQRLTISESQRPTARRWSPVLMAGGLGVLIVLIAFGVWLMRGGSEGGPGVAAAQPHAPLRLITVASREESEPPAVLTATGKIVSDHRVQVATKVSGQIVALYFEQGDRLEQGRIIARIEDVIFRAQRDQARALLERARANLEYQKINFERVRNLRDRAVAPEIEFADARRALRQSEAEVAAQQAALEFAQKALDDCEVVAPITGVVLQRNVEVGDFVAAEGGRGMQANAQFAEIADMSALRVEVDISELDIARLRREMPCVVVPDAYKDRRYSGRVMWIDPGANYSKATVQVKVRIQEPDEYLRVEGSAQVAFLAQEPETTRTAAGANIWIPRSACLLNDDKNRGRVFVVDKDHLRQRDVSVGLASGDLLEILDGLRPGQTIVAADLDRLADGQRLPRQRG